MPPTCPGGGPGTSGSPFSLQRTWKLREARRRRSGAYVHELLLGVILLGAVLPVAVGLIDDHLSLLLTVVSLQVLLEVSQLLLGEWGRAYPREQPSGHCQPREGCAKDPWAGLGGATSALTYTHTPAHTSTHICWLVITQVSHHILGPVDTATRTGDSDFCLSDVVSSRESRCGTHRLGWGICVHSM